MSSNTEARSSWDASGTRNVRRGRRAAIVLGLAVLCAGALAGLVVWIVAPWWGALAAAAVIGVAVGLFIWSSAEHRLLRWSGAPAADRKAHAQLFNVVEGLCAAAGLPEPRLHVLPNDGLNSFAFGRKPRRAHLVVTSAMLANLSVIELEGVVAQELMHIKAGDIGGATLVVGILGPLARPVAPRPEGVDTHRLLVAVLVPLCAVAGVATRYVLGTERESSADIAGVALTRYPPGLASAFEKMQDVGTTVDRSSPALSPLWLDAPVRGIGWPAAVWRLFEVQPPLIQRVQALREL
jgi:heat shock protein HtpX